MCYRIVTFKVNNRNNSPCLQCHLFIATLCVECSQKGVCKITDTHYRNLL